MKGKSENFPPSFLLHPYLRGLSADLLPAQVLHDIHQQAIPDHYPHYHSEIVQGPFGSGAELQLVRNQGRPAIHIRHTGIRHLVLSDLPVPKARKEEPGAANPVATCDRAFCEHQEADRHHFDPALLYHGPVHTLQLVRESLVFNR